MADGSVTDSDSQVHQGSGSPRFVPTIDLTWIGLIGLTLLTWILADSSELGLGRSGLVLVGIGIIKGLLIAAIFMELAHRSRLMLGLVGGYLVILWLVLWSVLAG